MEPISLHPDNGHYFRFRGRPTLLISSAEHYGAVLNGDFDFVRYLDELRARGLNQTRVFSGAYREVPGDFSITRNTLAPAPERFVAPWPRSETPGAADGLNKFDLSRWNDAYFARLDAFLRAASERGVVVELVLFCPFYQDSMWDVSPMNARNNVNGVGNVPREDAYMLRHADLLAVQEALVRRLATAVREFDNVYFEICNEPYSRGLPREWQDRIAATIVDAERDLPHPHLIAENVANRTAIVENANPYVSIFNFHYANPPTAVTDNYGLNRVIALDETGFRGTDLTVYRTDAWEFILAGGGVYSHLDYSFTTDQPDGTFAFPETTPGSGGMELRRQLQTLRTFVEGFDFVRMRPDLSVFAGLTGAETAWALVEPGKQYAVYLKGGAAAWLRLDVPPGNYRADWLHPVGGVTLPVQEVRHPGGVLELPVPSYARDIAFRLAGVDAG